MKGVFGGSKNQSKALYLKLTRPLRSLHESRQVLEILQQYGEVQYFQSFWSAPNPRPHHAAAVFVNPASASSLIDSSPIKFNIDCKPLITTQGSDAKNTSIELELRAERTGRNYELEITNGPYYGPFTPDLRNMQALGLKKAGVPALGLADWMGALGRHKRPGSEESIRIMRRKREQLRKSRLELGKLHEQRQRDPRSESQDDPLKE